MKKAIVWILCLFLLACTPACASSSKQNEPMETGVNTSALPESAMTSQNDPPATEEPTQDPSETPYPIPPLCNDNTSAHRQEARYGAIEELNDLYELATEIGNRYGIYIYIADLVPDQIFENDENEEQDDPVLIRSALAEIDRILAVYPDGFFDQFVYGDFVCLDLYLVGFSPIGMGYVSECQSDDGLHSYIVIGAEEQDLIDQFSNSLPHEITHLTDWRLGFVSEQEDGHLFSEERWMELNPEGFRYGWGDNDLELEMYGRFPTYFSYSYGAHDPLEDRATLFGGLLSMYFADDADALGYLPENCYAKLEFYMRCIRDGFDTTGWPEMTTWELMYGRIREAS